MTRSARLVFACSALLAAGCSAWPTAPASSTAPATRRAMTGPRNATHDDSEDPNPDGTCRSGYTVTNGRCLPI